MCDTGRFQAHPSPDCPNRCVARTGEGHNPFGLSPPATASTCAASKGPHMGEDPHATPHPSSKRHTHDVPISVFRSGHQTPGGNSVACGSWPLGWLNQPFHTLRPAVSIAHHAHRTIVTRPSMSRRVRHEHCPLESEVHHTLEQIGNAAMAISKASIGIFELSNSLLGGPTPPPRQKLEGGARDLPPIKWRPQSLSVSTTEQLEGELRLAMQQGDIAQVRRLSQCLDRQAAMPTDEADGCEDSESALERSGVAGLQRRVRGAGWDGRRVCVRGHRPDLYRGHRGWDSDEDGWSPPREEGRLAIHSNSLRGASQHRRHSPRGRSRGTWGQDGGLHIGEGARSSTTDPRSAHEQSTLDFACASRCNEACPAAAGNASPYSWDSVDGRAPGQSCTGALGTFLLSTPHSEVGGQSAGVPDSPPEAPKQTSAPLMLKLKKSDEQCTERALESRQRSYRQMRAEGKVVRHPGAIQRLSDAQVKRQLALLASLDDARVPDVSASSDERREALVALIKAEVESREALHGPDAYTLEDEVERLEKLGLVKRKAVARKLGRKAEWKDSSSSSSTSADEGGSGVDEDLLRQPDVHTVKRILDDRGGAAGREFLVQWKGWAPKWNSWEPEAHLLDKQMVRKYLRKKLTGEQSAGTPPPSRQRSKRRIAEGASKKARRAANADDEPAEMADDDV